MSFMSANQANNEAVKSELDDVEAEVLAKFLTEEWHDIPVGAQILSNFTKTDLMPMNNSLNVSNTLLKSVKNEPQDPMDWNSDLSELITQADLSKDNEVQDFLPPWISLKSEISKEERSQIVNDAMDQIDEFQSWRPTLKILPKPGCIYFCKAQLSDREKLHANDGMSWTSCGRSIKNDRVQSFYYAGYPNTKKMTPAQKKIYLYDTARSKNQILTKNITYRKTITYHKEGNFFMIEYTGDDKLLPWLKRKYFNFAKRPSERKSQLNFRLKVKKKPEPIITKKKTPVIPKKTPVVPKVIKPPVPVESSSNVRKAVAFKTVEPLVKMDDPKEINDLLTRNPFSTCVNDATSTKIMNPRPGELYMMNLSNLDTWSGVYHCDFYKWRLRDIQNWKDYGFLTFHFTLLKHSEPLSEFKKTIHYNPLTKMKLIQYHGSDPDGVPGSEKQ